MNNNTTQSIVYTRQQMLGNECTHEQYYSQFINPHILNIVGNHFEIPTLKKAFEIDPNLNSIRLSEWDGLAHLLKNTTIGAKIREAGDYPTLSGYVCILKEAARQLITNHIN